MHVVVLNLHAPHPIVYCARVVQNCMDEQRGGQRKCEEVDHGVGTREVQRAVGLVLGEIKPAAGGIEDLRGIIRAAEAVEWAAATHGHIREVPGLVRAFCKNSGTRMSERGETLTLV